MKVLYLVTGIRPPAASGSEFIKDLILTLGQRKEVDATILSPIFLHTQKGMLSWKKDMEKRYGVKFELINVPAFIQKRFILHIAISPILITFFVIKILLKNRFDVIHEFTSTPFVAFRSIIYKLFRVPSIFSLSVVNYSYLGNPIWFKIFDHASAYLMPSSDLAEKLKKLNVSEKKVFYVPPGIDIDRFAQRTNKKLARIKLRLPLNRFIFVYFGALTKEKGVEDIISAHKLLPPEIKEKIHIALFSHYLKGFKTYENYEKKLNLESLTGIKIYKDYVSIPLLLSATDWVVYVQQTGHGTTSPPIAIVETLASQKPVIVTQIESVSGLINSSNGILIPPSNPQSLRDAMVTAYTKNDNYNPNNNLEKFQKMKVADNIFSVYLKIYAK